MVSGREGEMGERRGVTQAPMPIRGVRVPFFGVLDLFVFGGGKGLAL